MAVNILDVVPNAAPPGSRFVTDPLLLGRGIGDVSKVTIIEGFAEVDADTDVFWSMMTELGKETDTDWVANTFKTVWDEGPCIVEFVLSPEIQTNSDDVTFRFTRDGMVREISWDMFINQRCWVGPAPVPKDMFTSTDPLAFRTTGQTLTNGPFVDQYHSNTLEGLVLPVNAGAAQLFNIPALYARKSLKIEIKVQTAITATANRERRAAVIGRLL